jgi:hypothetical protein
MLILWKILQHYGLDENLWVIIESLSTAATVTAILGAGLIAHNELSESNKSRYVSLMENIFHELNSEDQISARRWIYLELPVIKDVSMIDKLDDENKKKIKMALNSIDKVAFVTQAGWIPVEVIMNWINPMIVKLWEKLGPLVLLERVERNEPDYYLDAEIFAEECRKWREKKYPDSTHKWLDNSKSI